MFDICRESFVLRECLYEIIILNVQVESSRNPQQLPEVGSSVGSTVAGPVRSHPDPVSSHILDTASGRPAAGVTVTMYRMGGETAWTKLMSRWET